MLVRRKLFSTYIDEYGDERLYSTGELILDEEDYLNELMYSDLEERIYAKKNIRTLRKMMNELKGIGDNPEKFKRGKELTKKIAVRLDTTNPKVIEEAGRTFVSPHNLPSNRKLQKWGSGVTKEEILAYHNEIRPDITKAARQKAEEIGKLSPQQRQARRRHMGTQIGRAKNWGELGEMM